LQVFLAGDKPFPVAVGSVYSISGCDEPLLIYSIEGDYNEERK